MWEINVGSQSATFLLALALGLFFAAGYDCLKSLRRCFRHGAFCVALEDVLFSLFCAFCAFCLFMLRTKGEPRGYAYFAMAVGFVAWRLTFSKYLVKFLCRLIGALKSVFSKISCQINRFFGKIQLIIQKFLKKLLNWAKKGLKAVKRLVYNLFNKIIGK